MPPTTNPWVTNPKPNPAAQLRLFCFPYAGGGTTIFHAWRQALPTNVEIRPIRLPGRENRLAEKPLTHFADLIPALTEGLLPYLDKPFAFFGHSLGGFIGFEVARQLRRKAAPMPQHLFVSGCRAVHLPDPDAPVGHLPVAAFIDELRRLNGTPQAVFENRELLELLLPCIRADFQLVESYRYHAEAPLALSITGFFGEEDGKADRRLMAAWAEHTAKAFTLHALQGDHFFIHSQQARFLTMFSEAVVQEAAALMSV